MATYASDPTATDVIVSACTPNDLRQKWTIFSKDGSIKSGLDGRCLDVYECVDSNLAPVNVFPCHIGQKNQLCNSTNQQWHLNADSSITSYMNSNMCLDVYDFTGPNVELYSCNGGVNQKWAYNKTDQTLRSEGQCLTVDSDALEVWAGPLNDGSVAVVLLNKTKKTSSIVANWQNIGLNPKVKCKVRDVWARKDLGIFSGNFTASVASHGVMMIRVSPNS